MTLVLENIIKDHGAVADGKFVVGKVAYTTVVLPPMMETLNKPTFDLLQNFVQQGGRVVTFSSPTLVDGAENTAWKTLLGGQSVTSVPRLTNEVIRDTFSNADCRFSFSGR